MSTMRNPNERHHSNSPWDGAHPWAIELGIGSIELRTEVSLMIKNQEKIMSALDDLKAAITDLGSQLTDNNAEIEKLLTKITAPGTSDADVAAAVASIRGLIADNKTEVDKAKAAVPA